MRSYAPFAVGALAIAALLAPLARCESGCDSSAPQLTHSAPWLGDVLTLSVTQAPPDAAVLLLHSPTQAQQVTPFGYLELGRVGLTLLGSGQADASGSWSFDQPIPLDPALIEAEGHYQALVEDLAAPAGAVLSNARHLRYLGTRSYTLCTGRPDYLPVSFGRGRIDVHSVAQGSLVAAVDIGTTVGHGWSYGEPSAWRPVFSADLSRGAAAVDSDEVVVFDNFSAAVIATLPVAGCSPRLLPSADGQQAYVLDRVDSSEPGQVLVLDLASASFVARLELPGRAPGPWELDEVTGQVLVAELDAATGRTAARRVDMASLTVLDGLPLGDRHSAHFYFMSCIDGWLYAGTSAVTAPPWDGYFTAVNLADPVAAPSFVVVKSVAFRGAVAVPDSGLLLVAAGMPDLGMPNAQVWCSRLVEPSAIWPMSTPASWFVLGPSVARGTDLWVLSPFCASCDGGADDGEPARLWRLDTTDLSWWLHPTTWWSWDGPPVTLIEARGPLCDTLLLPRDGTRFAWPAGIDPQLTAVDPISGRITGSWVLDWGPLATWALQPDS